jgi:TPR repeat protein
VSDSEGSPHRISLSGTGIAGRKERKKPDRQSGAGAEADGYFRQAQAIGNFAEALPLFRRAAELGHAEAQYLVGSAYARGSTIVPRDDGLALHWFRLAAQQGHAKAQSSLAQMYKEGRGVGTDYAEAMKWYRTAAAAGDVGGQYGMALMYSNGQGVPKDEGIAVMWFRKAAAQGHFRAQEELKKRGLGW